MNSLPVISQPHHAHTQLPVSLPLLLSLVWDQNQVCKHEHTGLREQQTVYKSKLAAEESEDPERTIAFHWR